MSRLLPVRDDEPVWLETTERQPCPRCQAKYGCSVLENGGFVRCLNVVSERPFGPGGWLHLIEMQEVIAGVGVPLRPRLGVTPLSTGQSGQPVPRSERS
jgi:hypothetical protein